MGSLEELPPVLEVSHIQKFLNIGKNQAYDLCNSGQFHVVKVGRSIKISRDVFVNWLNGNGNVEQKQDV